MSAWFGFPPWIPIYHPQDDPSIPRCCMGDPARLPQMDVNGRCKCECHGDDESELFVNWRTTGE